MIAKVPFYEEKLKPPLEKPPSLILQLFLELSIETSLLKKSEEQKARLIEIIRALLQEKRETQREKEVLHEKIASLIPLQGEIIDLQNQLQLLSASPKTPSKADDDEKANLLQALKKAQVRLHDIEYELLTEREMQWLERDRLKEEKEELLKKLADLANQLQRQLELCRTHKEESLRFQNEIKDLSIESEAKSEEIAKLKAKIHELCLEKKESKADNSGELKARLEEAIHLINTMK